MQILEKKPERLWLENKEKQKPTLITEMAQYGPLHIIPSDKEASRQILQLAGNVATRKLFRSRKICSKINQIEHPFLSPTKILALAKPYGKCRFGRLVNKFKTTPDHFAKIKVCCPPIIYTHGIILFNFFRAPYWKGRILSQSADCS